MVIDVPCSWGTVKQVCQELAEIIIEIGVTHFSSESNLCSDDVPLPRAVDMLNGHIIGPSLRGE